ncbi:hypothetical protein ADUPG1_010365, partial [Aduncisulcus paluster]
DPLKPIPPFPLNYLPGSTDNLADLDRLVALTHCSRLSMTPTVMSRLLLENRVTKQAESIDLSDELVTCSDGPLSVSPLTLSVPFPLISPSPPSLLVSLLTQLSGTLARTLNKRGTFNAYSVSALQRASLQPKRPSLTHIPALNSRLGWVLSFRGIIKQRKRGEEERIRELSSSSPSSSTRIMTSLDRSVRDVIHSVIIDMCTCVTAVGMSCIRKSPSSISSTSFSSSWGWAGKTEAQVVRINGLTDIRECVLELCGLTDDLIPAGSESEGSEQEKRSCLAKMILFHSKGLENVCFTKQEKDDERKLSYRNQQASSTPTTREDTTQGLRGEPSPQPSIPSVLSSICLNLSSHLSGMLAVCILRRSRIGMWVGKSSSDEHKVTRTSMDMSPSPHLTMSSSPSHVESSSYVSSVGGKEEGEEGGEEEREKEEGEKEEDKKSTVEIEGKPSDVSIVPSDGPLHEDDFVESKGKENEEHSSTSSHISEVSIRSAISKTTSVSSTSEAWDWLSRMNLSVHTVSTLKRVIEVEWPSSSPISYIKDHALRRNTLVGAAALVREWCVSVWKRAKELKINLKTINFPSPEQIELSLLERIK